MPSEPSDSDRDCDCDSDRDMPRLAAPSTTSTVLNHTVAPFYACYLLRSFNPKRGGTYIGSTPDPPRRYKQHSGEIKGGAFKTRLGRPWEMELVVYGFPTKLQALQFEWAWQNPHASRLLHCPPPRPRHGDDVPDPTATALLAAKPVAQFPRTAASNRPLTKLQVLQFMLTVPPWRSFNLSVTCFSSDARAWWDRARQLGPVVRTEAGARKWQQERIKQGRENDDPWDPDRSEWLDRVSLELRLEGVDGKRLVRAGQRAEGDEGGRMRVDDDTFFDTHWSKWNDSIAANPAPSCDICARPIELEDHLSFLLCTSAATRCTALFHPTCLADHFLSSSPARLPPTAAPLSTRAAPLLPAHGDCPTCRAPLHWSDLVRGSYRRKEEVEGTRKKRRFEKGTRARELAARNADDSDERELEAEAAGTTNGRRKRAAGGRGKGKATRGVVSDDADDASDDDAVASEEEEQERSWARTTAAEGALEDVEGDNSEVGADDEPTTSIFEKKKPSKRLASISDHAPPPPTTTITRRGRRAAPTATLTAAFGSTKSALTSTSSTKEGASPPRRREIEPSLATIGSDDLPHPSALGAGSTRGTKQKPKKVVEYIELSD